MNRSNLNQIIYHFAGTTLMLTAACAHQAPPPLAAAQSAYREATEGPAKQQVPGYLDTAQRALMRAEASYDKNGDTPNSQDLAYIAQRLSQLAETEAQVEISKKEKAAADQQILTIQQEQQRSTAQQLTQTQKQLDSARLSLEQERFKAQHQADMSQAQQQMNQAQQQMAGQQAQLQQQMAGQQAQLESARHELDTERSNSQKMAAEAQAALEKAGQLSHSARGTVLTVPGNVLFSSGKTNLISGASSRLDSVVNALKQLKGQGVLIEGYTDSTGTRSLNQRLSQERAESVRNYLIRHGIDESRVTAKGMGPADPISDNATAEGRAQNRRVQLIFEDATS